MRRVVIALAALLCLQLVALLVVVVVVASHPKAAPIPTATPTQAPTPTPTWTSVPTWTPTATATVYVLPTDTPTPAPLPTPTHVIVRTYDEVDSHVAAQAYVEHMEPLLADMNDWGNRLIEVGDSVAANPYAGCEADYETLVSQGQDVVGALAAVEVPTQIAADHEVMVNTLGGTAYHLEAFRIALCVQQSEYRAMQELDELLDSEEALNTSAANIASWLSANR